MALVAGYHLQVGNLLIEDGSGTTSYRVTYMSFPEPAPDGVGGHFPAQRRFDVTVTGDSVSDLSAKVAALRRECVRDKTLQFRPSASGDLLSCRIREASVVESEVDMLDRVSLKADLSVTLTTDQYWLAPWGAEVDATAAITSVPGHIDIADPGGEVDALLSMRVVPVCQGTGLFVGVEPDPGEEYRYLDDYGVVGDINDANALGTLKKRSVVLTSTMSVAGGGAALDTTDNTGTHIAVARCSIPAGTPSNFAIAPRVETAGNMIAAEVSVDSQAQTMTTLDLIGYELGIVQIPAGTVPTLSTGAGYAPEDISAEQTASDGQTAGQMCGQTIKLAAGERPTRVTFKSGTIDGNGWVYECRIKDVGSGQVYDISGTVEARVADTEYTFSFNSGWVAPHSGLYWFALSKVGLYYEDGAYWRDNSAGGYADGSEIAYDGTIVTGHDLFFRLYSCLPLGFVSTLQLLGSSTETNRAIDVDYIERIPVDFAAIAYRLAASGPLGLYYDADTDTPYVADADGIGPSVFEDCTINKPLRLRPGVTNRVVFGVLQGDTPVAGMTALKYRIRRRYLTATG